MSELDLRTLPPSERHRRVHGELDRLSFGDTIVLVNDHRPSPLRYELDATRPGQYRWMDGESGPERWTAEITCLAQILDVRPILERGEEPFDTIMSAVGALEEGQPLVIIAPFEPVPLEGVLSAQGFRWEAEVQEDGNWRVAFFPET